MADISPPGRPGDRRASDHIGGVDYPRIKVTWGAAGTADDASSATPLPTDVKNQTALGLAVAASSLPVVQASDHVPQCALSDIVSGNATNTDGASTSVIAASGSASVGRAITTIILTNTSATDIYVEIEDGSTVILTISLPQVSGSIVNLTVPIIGSGNTAWNYNPSAAASTTFCSMVGFDVAV